MIRKKIQLLTAAMGFMAMQGYAQLYNNGATIKIQPGAIVFVQGDVQNNTGSTLTNDGKLEVQGSYTNAATYNTTTADDSLILSGAGNVTLNGGASSISYLTINKAANTNNVTLSGNTTVGVKLDYLSGNLTTDPVNTAFVLSSPTSAVYNFAAGREITGRVQRTGWANGAASVFNQPNMQVTTNAGTAPTAFTVNMIPSGDPSLNEREVKRQFGFTTTGGTGFTTDIRFAYQDVELNVGGNANTEAGLVPWQLVGGTEWNGKLTPITRDGSTNYVAYTGITTTELANEWKLADAKYSVGGTAYMRGAWNNATGLMRTTLQTSPQFPLAQPYSGAPTNYAGTESVASVPNANIVDWVLLELRKPSTGLPADANQSSIIGRKAVFLLNNGSLVDLDGVTTPSFEISKQGNAFMVVKHRNHIAMMSNSIPSNVAGTYTNSFSSLANVYANPSATSAPATILFATAPGNALYGMWPGDVNRNGSVTASDVSPINVAISGPSTGNANVYNVRDVNLDRNVTSADVSNTNFSIANFANASVLRGMAVPTTTPRELKSHVPGEGN